MTSPCCGSTNQSPLPPRHAAAAELHDVLSELVRLVQLRDRNRICCHDVSVTQAHAIDVLHRAPSITLQDLSAALYLDKSTTSRVVDALERKGHVSRREHPQDRRAVVIELTRQGRRLHHRLRASLVEEVSRLIEDVSPEARTEMTRLLRRVMERMAVRAGVAESCCRTGPDGGEIP